MKQQKLSPPDITIVSPENNCKSLKCSQDDHLFCLVMRMYLLFHECEFTYSCKKFVMCASARFKTVYIISVEHQLDGVVVYRSRGAKIHGLIQGGHTNPFGVAEAVKLCQLNCAEFGEVL